AVRCGQAFGIDLYGVDIIESEGKPYVVDMCSIPGFKGVPDAVPLLTRYFYEAAERGASGESPSQIAATADSGHDPHAELTALGARVWPAPSRTRWLAPRDGSEDRRLPTVWPRSAPGP